MGVRMLYSFYFYDLGEISGRADIRQHGLQLAYEVLDDFYVAEKNAILEFVSENGNFVDTPPGRTCVPGHALEALWFLITIFERAGDRQRIETCCRLIQRH